ncbi:ImmA/IrrE family metallo-endopeptidase [Paenibacillus sp. M2]|uniref:ImmA/IrrE family metallo-endopeptidase n=1 Tax=Paenibacillus sp. M2 TaxID=3341793 RepID=UPI0039890690
MMMIFKPNFKKAEMSAYRLLREIPTDRFPIKVKDMAKEFENLKIRTYTWFAEKRKMTFEEVCTFAESEEGCCYYQKKNHQYLILYNEKISTPGRRRWTIAHEIGHYVLRHNEISNKTIISRSSLTKDQYKSFEQEADCFARSLLVPSSVLYALRKFNAKDLSSWFDISFLAAKNTLSFFSKGTTLGKTHNPKDFLVKKYSDFIFTINNEHHCNNCKHNFIKTNPNYCPVCASKKISNKRIEFDMKYDKVKLDESSRAITCPKCSNEEINGNDYCKICGVYVVNRCNNKEHWNGKPEIICDELADGDARFCTKCGHATTFYDSDLLPYWELEYKHGKKQEHKSYLEHLDEEAEMEAEMEYEEEKRERTTPQFKILDEIPF